MLTKILWTIIGLIDGVKQYNLNLKKVGEVADLVGLVVLEVGIYRTEGLEWSPRAVMDWVTHDKLIKQVLTEIISI